MWTRRRRYWIAGTLFAAIGIVVAAVIYIPVFHFARPFSWSEALASCTREATRVRLAPAVPYYEDELPNWPDVTDADDVRELAEALEINPPESLYMVATMGAIRFDFYRGDTLIGSLALLGDSHLRQSIDGGRQMRG